MGFRWLFQDAPLWFVLIVLVAAMALACECGVWAHRWLRLAARRSDEKAAEDYVLSGVLGLLALLVAFTFGMALNRFETRRDLMIKEANALSTAWLRTSFVEEPGPLRALMRRYADARLEFGLTSGEREHAAELRAARLEPEIWAEAVRQVGPSRQTPLPAFVLDPLNTAFDTAAARKTELAARLPSRVLLTLILYMVASAAVLGYAVAGAKGRFRVAPLALFALFAVALGVILDLDRPRTGPLRVPQGAMADTVRLMATGVPDGDPSASAR